MQACFAALDAATGVLLSVVPAAFTGASGPAAVALYANPVLGGTAMLAGAVPG